jgi:DNA polymerase-3 subunit delta
MPAPKTKGASRIHVVVGSDESEVKRAAKKLADALAPAGDFGSEIIDGSVDYADQAAQRIHQTIEALLTFPFFGGEKLVWLKNATFLDDSPTGRAEAVVEALDKLAELLRASLPDKI